MNWQNFARVRLQLKFVFIVEPYVFYFLQVKVMFSYFTFCNVDTNKILVIAKILNCNIPLKERNSAVLSYVLSL